MHPTFPTRSRLLAATWVFCLAAGLSASATQTQVPAGSPRIGFAPIGTPFGSSAAYSYLAGKPVLRLPSGLTIDPYNTGAGMTLYDPAEQQQAQQQRYQVQSAQAAQAYQEQMAMRQKAMAQANGQGRNPVVRQNYDLKTGAAKSHGKGEKQAPVFDDQGRPIWPDFAAKNERRTAAEQAIAAVQAEAKANGSASVASVVNAKQALRTYGVPALKSVPRGSRILSERLREHLMRMDQALDAFAEPAADAK